jgi:hypothetical protein
VCRGCGWEGWVTGTVLCPFCTDRCQDAYERRQREPAPAVLPPEADPLPVDQQLRAAGATPLPGFGL